MSPAARGVNIGTRMKVPGHTAHYAARILNSRPCEATHPLAVTCNILLPWQTLAMRLRQSATPPAKSEAARAFCALPRGVRTGEPPPLLTRPTPRSLRAAFAPACLLTRFHPLALPADESEFALRATPPWRRREQLQQAGLLHGRARQELRRRGRRGLPPSPPRFPCAAAVPQLPPSPRATALRERRGAAVAPAGASDAGVVVGCGCRVGDLMCVLDAVCALIVL